jgi:hypothetical protein
MKLILDNKASNTKIDFLFITSHLLMTLRLFGKVSLGLVMRFIKEQTGIIWITFMQQHKLEIKEKLFIRGYTTSEDGGNSYDMLLRV